jgi:3-oxoacyl-[acyl-carrier protein] reductase
VEAVTLIVASELRGRDINVNAIAPGPTAAPMFLQANDDEAVAHLAQAAPLNRLSTPEDVTHAAAFLTSALPGHRRPLILSNLPGPGGSVLIPGRRGASWLAALRPEAEGTSHP